MASRTQLRRSLTRPALLLVYAVVAVALSVHVGSLVRESVQVGRVVDDFRVCQRVSDADCLTEITDGRLSGPQGQFRSAHDEWRVVGGGLVDEFVTSSSHSDRLRKAESVRVYEYDGKVAVIVTDDGDEVRPLDVGTRGAVERGSWTLGLIGVAIACVGLAVRKRRQWGDWWTADGPEPTGRDHVGVVLVVPAAVTAFGMAVVGLSWQSAVAGGLGVFAVLLVSSIRRWRGRARS